MDELQYIEQTFDNEINYYKSYEKQLRRFFYYESKKLKIISIDFERIITELQDIKIHINELESRKRVYLKIQGLL
jgi:hypothetical protein